MIRDSICLTAVGVLAVSILFSIGDARADLAGDYDVNGFVDALDAGVWAASLGQIVLPGTGADGTGDGIVDQSDYALLTSHLGESLDELPIDVGPAALIYFRDTGNVVLDQSNADGGIVTAFFLNSAGNGLIPGVANFPFPTAVPTQIDGVAQIGQIDVTATGYPAVQHVLGAVLSAGLSYAELQSELANSFYMPAHGFARSPFLLIHVPEPSTLCLAFVLGLLIPIRTKHR
jgi:hypothetical protein